MIPTHQCWVMFLLSFGILAQMTWRLMVKQEQRDEAAPQENITTDATAPDLSICIVNWNCSDYLRGLLTSIQAEREGLAVEVIVVDNASTDNSVSMVQTDFPEVRLIRNHFHQPIAKANNQAAALARSNLLFFLNNDTIVGPRALTSLVRFFEQHPEIAAVGPSLVFPDGKPQGTVRKTLGFRAALHRVLLLRWTRIFRAAEYEYQQVNFDLRKSAYVENLVGAALAVRRQPFASIGGWDEAFEFRLDDVDLSSRISRMGKMYYLAEAQVVHWGGIATELDESYAYRCSEYSYVHYLRKHYGVKAARIYKVFVIADMPLRIFVLALTWLVKRLFGNRERAARNYRKLAAATQFFLYALPNYWRS